jgi:hypothetical protein
MELLKINPTPGIFMRICRFRVLCCQVEVSSATGWSIVQRNVTECVYVCVCVFVSLSVIRCNLHLYTYNE